jgi:hypothetical protein
MSNHSDNIKLILYYKYNITVIILVLLLNDGYAYEFIQITIIHELITSLCLARWSILGRLLQAIVTATGVIESKDVQLFPAIWPRLWPPEFFQSRAPLPIHTSRKTAIDLPSAASFDSVYDYNHCEN